MEASRRLWVNSDAQLWNSFHDLVYIQDRHLLRYSTNPGRSFWRQWWNISVCSYYVSSRYFRQYFHGALGKIFARVVLRNSRAQMKQTLMLISKFFVQIFFQFIFGCLKVWRIRVTFDLLRTWQWGVQESFVLIHWNMKSAPCSRAIPGSLLIRKGDHSLKLLS